MLARYDPVGKRTAVVTTVEIALYGDDGAVTRIGGDLTERSGRMALTADGRLLAIAGESSGTVTAFDLTTGQAVGASVRRRRSGRAPRVRARRIGTRRQHRGVGHPRAPRRHPAPSVLVDSAEGPLGPAAIAPDGSWIVVPVASADGARIALWRAGGVSMIDLPVADGVNAPRRGRVAQRHSRRGGDRGRVTTRSRRVSRSGTSRRARSRAPSRSSTAAWRSPWAFGPDDRVLVADGAVTTPVERVGRAAADPRPAGGRPRCSRCSASATERGFMTVLQDGTIDLWDRDGGRLATIGEPGTTLVDVAVAPDSSTVTTVDFFGAVRRWDIAGDGSSPFGTARRRGRRRRRRGQQRLVRARRIGCRARDLERPRRDDRRHGRSHPVVRATARQRRLGRLLAGLDRDGERDGRAARARVVRRHGDDLRRRFRRRGGHSSVARPSRSPAARSSATRSDSRRTAICWPPTRTTSRCRSTTRPTVRSSTRSRLMRAP